MVRLAWIENRRQNFVATNGWYDMADLSRFCEVKQMTIAAVGLEAWKDFRAQLFEKLDGAKDMGWEKFWSNSIVSTNCNRVM